MTHIPVNGNKKLMNTTYGHQLKSNSSQALTSFRPKDFARNLQASTPAISNYLQQKKHLKVDDISFVEETRDLDGDGATFVRINFAKNSSDAPLLRPWTFDLFDQVPCAPWFEDLFFAQQNYKSDGQQINSPAPAISLLK